jgi:GR25 family glycosyltransferase involved in LPS biosynthesis
MEGVKGFIIHSIHEPDRAAHVNALLKSLPNIQRIEAIYPSKQKVPFLQSIIQQSIFRTGKALTYGEIGVLMTNRLIWKKIVDEAITDEEPFLILESDSLIKEPILLHKDFYTLANQHDMFYFGGWLGNIQLFKSTKKNWSGNFWVGEPYIKTLCSGYGYSVNKKAAKVLLQKTTKVAYAFDEVRRYLKQDELKLGAVIPEWITQKPGASMIGKRPTIWLSARLFRMVLDTRNYFICLFK